MRKLKEQIDEQAKKRLAEVIAEQEIRTTGEIRLMIVGSSDGYHVWVRNQSSSFVLIFILASLNFSSHQSNWSFYLHLGLSVILSAAWILTPWIDFLRRSIIPWPIRSQMVNTQAELEFYRQGMSATAGRTGVLIYMSLFERQVVVLGDKSITDKLSPGTWDQVVENILVEAKKGNLVQALENALYEVGDLLAIYFPVKEGQKNDNELENHLIVRL